jgi:hyperosmotically inducible periplasmic protein
MRLGTKRCIAVCVLGLITQMPSGFGQQAAAPTDAQQQQLVNLAEAVRKAIVTNPQYGVFDYLHFAIQGNNVILRGFASRPTLKSGVEASVKRIPGVGNVQNEIEVLPVGQNDDRIRAAVYRAIYSYAPLQRYTSNRGGAARIDANSVARRAGGITNDPPMGWHAIHIIVKNGNVMLEGVVDNTGDFAFAGMRANQVSGVFSVDNNLQVAGQQKA